MRRVLLTACALALAGHTAALAQGPAPEGPVRGGAPPRAAAPMPSFDQLDANEDGALSRGEVTGTRVEQRFGTIDSDRDGTIARREFMAAMGLEAHGPSTFDLLDANGNGALSPDEASVNPPLAAQFIDSDADGDGNIDRSEFSAFEAMLAERRGVDLPWGRVR